MDPPIKISNGLGLERLIMGPNAMCPFIPFLINCLAKWHLQVPPAPFDEPQLAPQLGFLGVGSSLTFP